MPQSPMSWALINSFNCKFQLSSLYRMEYHESTQSENGQGDVIVMRNTQFLTLFAGTQSFIIIIYTVIGQ